MNIVVNGVEKQFANDSTLSAVLEDNGNIVALIVAELNGVIVPKNEYSSTIIREGDNLELLSFVGGG
jgi:sulfur carrier protein